MRDHACWVTTLSRPASAPDRDRPLAPRPGNAWAARVCRALAVPSASAAILTMQGCSRFFPIPRANLSRSARQSAVREKIRAMSIRSFQAAWRFRASGRTAAGSCSDLRCPEISSGSLQKTVAAIAPSPWSQPRSAVFPSAPCRNASPYRRDCHEICSCDLVMKARERWIISSCWAAATPRSGSRSSCCGCRRGKISSDRCRLGSICRCAAPISPTISD